MKKVVKEVGLAFLILAPLLCSAQEDVLTAGISVVTPISQPVVDNTGFAFEIGMTRKKTKYYYIGMNVDIIFQTKRRYVDIPNNFLSNESIVTGLNLASFSLANRFDLTPDSRVKIFFDANVGVRIGKFEATHEGYLLLIKAKDNLYSKTTVGLATQFFLCFYFPLRESSKLGFQFKTGVALGSPITYIANESVTYTNSVWTYGEPRQSGASYWVNAIDMVWHFDR